MKGTPSKESKSAAKARHEQLVKKGWIRVKDAVPLVKRSVRTINHWFDTGLVRGELFDHKRYVRRAELVRIEKTRVRDPHGATVR